MIESPCINVCKMDDATGLCQGCYRSLDEIAAWAMASDDAKRQILVAVEQRRFKLDPDRDMVGHCREP